jgi:hypothetical protein
MGVETQWHNPEHTIIEIKFSGRWTWDDLRAAKVVCEQLLDSVNYCVGIIINQGKANWIPGGYHANLREIIRPVHRNAGFIAIVSSSTLVRELFQVFRALNGHVKFKYGFAATIQEAQLILMTARYNQN